MNDVQTPQNPLFSTENQTNFGPGEPGAQATARHPQSNDETPSIDECVFRSKLITHSAKVISDSSHVIVHR
jgi:hypothetical protein